MGQDGSRFGKDYPSGIPKKGDADGGRDDGRQPFAQWKFLIFQNFKRNKVEVGMTEFRDLQNVRIKGDNLSAFMTDWDSCIYGMIHQPSPEILESLFGDQVRQCRHFEQAYELYVA